MKNLKLLSKKILSNIFLVVFLILSFDAHAEDQPVDIWNIDKKKN